MPTALGRHVLQCMLTPSRGHVSHSHLAADSHAGPRARRRTCCRPHRLDSTMTMKHEFECPFRLAGRRVWVAGHRGMVGQALVRRLQKEKCEILTADRKAVDLCKQQETH